MHIEEARSMLKSVFLEFPHLKDEIIREVFFKKVEEEADRMDIPEHTDQNYYPGQILNAHVQNYVQHARRALALNPYHVGAGVPHYNYW